MSEFTGYVKDKKLPVGRNSSSIDAYVSIEDNGQLDTRIDDSKWGDQMDEREDLFPSLVAAHEWITGRDTLCWTPCR